MPAPLLLLTELPVIPDGVDAAVAAVREHAPAALLYAGLETPSVLLLTPLGSLAGLGAVVEDWAEVDKALTPWADGDVRRQVLRFVGAPRAGAELSDSPFIQLRHVEVKLPKLEEYLAWREETIFDVVRAAPAIDVFLAYHSLLSTEPGVMFIAGFSGPAEEYRSAFETPRYAEITEYAHRRFITESGLYTRIYRRVP
jgi:hypothetical protein